MLYYVYITQNGIPKTGLSPDFESLDTGTTGDTRIGLDPDVEPAINEIGGGMYSFEVVYGSGAWDVTNENLVGVIDADPTGAAGMTNLERYIPIVLDRSIENACGTALNTEIPGSPTAGSVNALVKSGGGGGTRY